MNRTEHSICSLWLLINACHLLSLNGNISWTYYFIKMSILSAQPDKYSLLSQRPLRLTEFAYISGVHTLMSLTYIYRIIGFNYYTSDSYGVSLRDFKD